MTTAIQKEHSSVPKTLTAEQSQKLRKTVLGLRSAGIKQIQNPVSTHITF